MRRRGDSCRAGTRRGTSSFHTSRCNVPRRRPTKTIEEGRKRERVAAMPVDTLLYRVTKITKKTVRNGVMRNRRLDISILRRVIIY